MATLIDQTIEAITPKVVRSAISDSDFNPDQYYFHHIYNSPYLNDVMDQEDLSLAISNYKEEAAEITPFTTGYTQLITNELSFFIIIQSGKEDDFDETILQNLRGLLRTALTNTVLTGYETNFYFTGGEIFAAESGIYVWEDRYQIESYFRK